MTNNQLPMKMYWSDKACFVIHVEVKVNFDAPEVKVNFDAPEVKVNFDAPEIKVNFDAPSFYFQRRLEGKKSRGLQSPANLSTQP
ncbi:MAG: hypothetical protein H6632_11750 [Anaerolineales bacterium]|nr:hypothetical protein [Anaerolineales bacterium]